MAVIRIPAEGTTAIFNGTRLNDFAAGDAIQIAFANPATAKTIGINNSTSIKNRIDANVADITVRVLRFTDTDIFLQGLINENAPVVIDGSVKRNFIRDGVDGVETYTIESGSITTQPTAMANNQDGEEVMEYVVNARSVKRTL
jgi:hypothetical protein